MKAKLEALNEKLKDLLLNLRTSRCSPTSSSRAEGAQTTGNAGDDVVDGEFTEK